MDASLSAEQRDLARAVGQVLAGREQDLLSDGLCHAAWADVVNQGLAGVGVAEDAGGSGGGVLDLAVVAHQVGFAGAGVPLATTALAAALIEATGAAPAVIAPALEGEQLVGISAPRIHDDLVVESDRLSGLVGAVPFGDALDRLVLGTRGERETTDVWSLDLSADGVEIHSGLSLDLSEPAVLIELDGVRPQLVGVLDAGATSRWRARARTVLAADVVGTAQRALSEARAHAAVREQFGRPIGAFQAVKHALAHQFVELEVTLPLIWKAAHLLDIGHTDAVRSADVAVAAAVQVSEKAAAESLQLLGGIGFTWEHPAHRLLRRTMARQLWIGDLDQILDQIAAGMPIPRQQWATA